MKVSLKAMMASCIALLTSYFVNAQSDLYDIGQIQKIEIVFSQSNWDYQLDTSKAGADGYIMATQVLINGISFDSVGVKYKGNSSYSISSNKNPFNISLDEYKSQDYFGHSTLKLSNCYQDPSMIREVLAYKILASYMDCPKSNFAQVYINGNYIGLYSNDENIGNTFLGNKFNSTNGTFFKCNPIVTPSPTTKCNLKYINTDSSSYFNYYELKSSNGWNQLVRLCDTVTNYGSSLESIIDIDRVIWMLAYNAVTVNLDSYSGVFAQNYYLYRDINNRFVPVTWDLNMAFGGFPFVGSGATSMGSLTVTNMQQLPLNIHVSDNFWPLINDVFNNPMWKRMFYAHAKTISDEYFTSGVYQSMALTYQALIDTAVQSDVNKMFTYSQFQSAMNTDITVGSYVVPGISNLFSNRTTFLQSTPEFQASEPVIAGVISSPAQPTIYDTVWINCTVTNGTTVLLGTRDNIFGKFIKQQMYDDGLHHDGGAGDGIYGASIICSSTQMDYFIYSENANVGKFLPARAEHEYFHLNVSNNVVYFKEVAFNEIMAKNDAAIADQNGEFDDWMELYNTSNHRINLSDLYLSDDKNDKLKWRFPISASIDSHSELIVWTDMDSTQQGLHTNFKLSSAGDSVYLSNSAGFVIDSVCFGPQSADISYYRCPNGIGNFGYTLSFTFNQSNCPTGVDEISAAETYVYPNPATSSITVQSKTNINNIKMFDLFGQCVLNIKTNNENNYRVELNDFKEGIYLLQLNNSNEVKKVQILNQYAK
ncbi:MAG: CotH kinase family protein [Bacteroidota bacterium]